MSTETKGKPFTSYDGSRVFSSPLSAEDRAWIAKNQAEINAEQIRLSAQERNAAEAESLPKRRRQR